jgi:hypothetical protein
MRLKALDCFDAVLGMDFEYGHEPGNIVKPVCGVARNMRDGRVHRVWLADGRCAPPLHGQWQSPLMITYNAVAEISCYLALGWAPPPYVLDLYIEYRNKWCGTGHVGFGLLHALSEYGVQGLAPEEKEIFQARALLDAAYSEHDRKQMLAYCQTDTDAVLHLLPKMLPEINLEQALLRGKYQVAVAHMEHVGLPIDAELLGRLRWRWNRIKNAQVKKADKNYGVFVVLDQDDPESPISFNEQAFEQYVKRLGIDWPRLESGKLCIQDSVFKEKALKFPALYQLRQIRKMKSQMDKFNVLVGRDGRNRCSLWPFKSVTGRNQPSNAEYLMGLPSGYRALAKAPPGHALLYCDWSGQECALRLMNQPTP